MTHSHEFERAKDKIRALLNLGADGSGATEAEAENALRFARKLMLLHNVREGDLEERDAHENAAEAERTEYDQATATTEGSAATRWEVSLVNAITTLVGTCGVYSGNPVERRRSDGTLEFNPVTGRPMIRRSWVFYGPAEDARDAASLYREWSMAIVGLARMKFGGALKGPGRDYCCGFASALLAKARAMKREEQQLIGDYRARTMLPAGETRGSALVVLNASALMDAKRDRAGEWLRREKGVKLRSSSRSYGGHGDAGAYGAGQADGQRANFGRSRTKKLGGGS